MNDYYRYIILTSLTCAILLGYFFSAPLGQVSTRVSQLQVPQTPGEKPPPQWWHFVEAIKKKNPYVYHGGRPYHYYDIVAACGHQIDRSALTLTIIFPEDCAPLLYDSKPKLFSDIAIEAGHVFEGYAVNWTVQK